MNEQLSIDTFLERSSDESIDKLIEYADISTQKFKAMTNIEYYYHNGIGQKEIEGTGWGVYNALTGYYSNMENNEGTKRLDTLLYGDRARKIQLFGETILAQAI